MSLRLWNWTGASTSANTDAESLTNKIPFKSYIIIKKLRFKVYLLTKENIHLSPFAD